MYLTYEFAPKNQFLFKEGDHGTDFYIIIRGKIDIQKNTETFVNLNGEDYFKLLKRISDRGYHHLALKSAKANNKHYNIHSKDLNFEVLILMSFLIKYRYYVKNNYSCQNHIKLFKEYEVNPLDYGLVLEELDKKLDTKKEILLNAFRIMFEKLNISKMDLSHYIYLEKYEVKKKILIYNNEVILSLNPGDYFGELALENKTFKR